MTFHFDCVFYYVSDLERSIAFYRDVLGFQLISQDVIALFDIDGVLFEIVPSASELCIQGHRIMTAILAAKSALDTLYHRAKPASESAVWTANDWH